MRLVWLACLIVSACTAGGGGRDAGPRDSGPPRLDSGMDAGARHCETSAECNDTFDCTLDMCVVGNVCDYTPIDAMCNVAAGERCVPGRGCVMGTPTECDDPTDCDNGLYCDGLEQCVLNTCVPADRGIDCNDGNDCTIDMCDNTARGCSRTIAPGCDAGTVIGRDAGPPCGPFDPGADYSGMFLMLPAQNCGGGLGSYTVDTVVFSVSGGTLTAMAGPFRLTQTPAPTGAAFDVSGSTGCADVRLVGSFDCDSHFTATWTADHSGGCAACGFASDSVMGIRF
jgi:hypothetical protein